MTDYLPFTPAPARLWTVELVALDPMRPLPRRVWAVQWTVTPGEAVERTAWQAQAEGDLPLTPYTWRVEPHEVEPPKPPTFGEHGWIRTIRAGWPYGEDDS